MKVIRAFRIESEKWEEFKKVSFHSKPTKIVREFINWYTKYHELWLDLIYLFQGNPVCSFCGEEFKSEAKEEEKGVQALRDGFRVMLVVEKPVSTYMNFRTSTLWICEDCYEKLREQAKQGHLF